MSEKIQINARALGLIGLLGGLAGAINAVLLEFLNRTFGRTFGFDDVVVGLCAGSFMAVIPFSFSFLLWGQTRLIRWTALPVVGWVTGWLVGVPLLVQMAFRRVYDVPRPPMLERVIEALVWPLYAGSIVGGIFGPVLYGFAGMIFYFLLNLSRQLTTQRLLRHLMVTILSGCFFYYGLGYYLGYWYLPNSDMYKHETVVAIVAHTVALLVLPGMIWGSLVGFGVWKSQQDVQRLGSHV